MRSIGAGRCASPPRVRDIGRVLASWSSGEVIVLEFLQIAREAIALGSPSPRSSVISDDPATGARMRRRGVMTGDNTGTWTFIGSTAIAIATVEYLERTAIEDQHPAAQLQREPLSPQ